MDGFQELNKDSLATPQGIAELNRMIKTLFDNASGDGKDVRILNGYGSPEGVIVASVGSLYLRKNGIASNTLYIKEANNDSAIGWTSK